jgi:hypothetical protein
LRCVIVRRVTSLITAAAALNVSASGPVIA